MTILVDNCAYTKKNRHSQKACHWMSGNDYRKTTRVGRNRAFKNGLCDGATLRNLKAVFLTLTYEGNRHNSGFSSKRFRLSDKLSKIRQHCVRHDIPVMGIKSLEKHQDGTPHLHLLTFLREQDIKAYLDIVRHYFPSPVNQNGKALQIVREGEEKQVGHYLIKIEFVNDDESLTSKISTASEISYFGLRKGAVTHWDVIYRQKRPLSHQENLVHQHIRDKQYYSALVMLNVFEPFDRWVRRVNRKNRITVRHGNRFLKVNKPKYKIMSFTEYKTELRSYGHAEKPYGKGKERYRIESIPRQCGEGLFWSRGPPCISGMMIFLSNFYMSHSLQEIFMMQAIRQVPFLPPDNSRGTGIRGPPYP
ncbi:replication endonuclease [Acetobacter persici]|uniref:replication endonuclease n=1 Tax=Acetobacter persici TaxID=1076596 RepID=UPI0020CDA454|nr:replication endonuclease [Acetobacter persici]MCP9319149.1 replication endonuclease [Acetobacter persici]